MTHVVIVGDVHGNSRALRAALEQAERGPCDHLVFVGDLLTYGHDVDETLELVATAQQTHAATLLMGNHDQMYFDLGRGERSYFERLPDWIRESVEKTLERLDLAAFRDRLVWKQETVIDKVLVAHAGPFGDGDWTYIAAVEHHQRAAAVLAQRGLSAGVFGHTHRARWYVGDPSAATRDVELDTVLRAQHPVILVANAGAVGQPRDSRGRAVILRLSITDAAIEGVFEPIAYDVRAHIEALRAIGLSTTTTDRLCAYFATT